MNVSRVKLPFTDARLNLPQNLSLVLHSTLQEKQAKQNSVAAVLKSQDAKKKPESNEEVPHRFDETRKGQKNILKALDDPSKAP